MPRFSDDEQVARRRLGELRVSRIADATLQNLVGVLNQKLELSARLPVLAYEASMEGHDECAALFRSVAEGEQEDVSELLEALKAYIPHSTGGPDRP